MIREYACIKKKVDSLLLKEAYSRKIHKEEFMAICKRICKRHKLSFKHGQFNISSLHSRSEGGIITDKDNDRIIIYVYLTPDELNWGTLLHEFTHAIEYYNGYLSKGHDDKFVSIYTKLLNNFSNGLYY